MDWRDSEYVDDLDRLVLGTPFGPEIVFTMPPGWEEWLDPGAPTLGEMLVARREREAEGG